MKQQRSGSADLKQFRRPWGAGGPGNSAHTNGAGQDELAHFFAKSQDLLCIAGFDGYFKRLNPAWTTRLGWALEELEQKPFLAFVHADDRDATALEIARLAEGGVTELFENRVRHQDGSFRWLRWNAQPVPGRQRIYAIARDVTRQRQLEAEVLEIADREKERLGRELHDGLCQSMAGIAALSSTLSRTLAGRSDSAGSTAAQEISGLLNETIGQARDLAHGLGLANLDGTRLDSELKTLALNIEHLFCVSCTLECDRPIPRLRQQVEAHLFRIVQEATNNAISHGRADRIDIRLSCVNGEGRLSVRDDGVGLPDEAGISDGIGMRTMAYRANQIGASLEVRRRDPRGTVVDCTFTLPDTTNACEKPDHERSNG